MRRYLTFGGVWVTLFIGTLIVRAFADEGTSTAAATRKPNDDIDRAEAIAVLQLMSPADSVAITDDSDDDAKAAIHQRVSDIIKVRSGNLRECKKYVFAKSTRYVEYVQVSFAVKTVGITTVLSDFAPEKASVSMEPELRRCIEKMLEDAHDELALQAPPHETRLAYKFCFSRTTKQQEG